MDQASLVHGVLTAALATTEGEACLGGRDRKEGGACLEVPEHLEIMESDHKDGRGSGEKKGKGVGIV